MDFIAGILWAASSVIWYINYRENKSKWMLLAVITSVVMSITYFAIAASSL